MKLTFLAIASWSAFAVTVTKPNNCQWNEACTLEVPDATCADGKPSFVRAVFRENAEQLMIFMNGGGACWDKISCGCDHESCSGKTASPLKRPNPLSYGEWNAGNGFRNSQNPENPLNQNFNIVEIPYCTGDAYAGNAITQYTSKGTVHHLGYKSTTANLTAIHNLIPNPTKLVFMGCSAGGLGVAYNAHQAAQIFDQSSLYVVSDAGTPFKSPHVKSSQINNAFSSWNIDATWPGADSGLDGVRDMSDIWRWNGQVMANAKFALISSYKDRTMTGFSLMLGATNPFHVVENMINDVAKNDFQPNTHGFYIESTQHCFYESDPSQVTTNGVKLSAWVQDMINDSPSWQNQMPHSLDLF